MCLCVRARACARLNSASLTVATPCNVLRHLPSIAEDNNTNNPNNENKNNNNNHTAPTVSHAGRGARTLRPVGARVAAAVGRRRGALGEVKRTLSR